MWHHIPTTGVQSFRHRLKQDVRDGWPGSGSGTGSGTETIVPWNETGQVRVLATSDNAGDTQWLSGFTSVADMSGQLYANYAAALSAFQAHFTSGADVGDTTGLYGASYAPLTWGTGVSGFCPWGFIDSGATTSEATYTGLGYSFENRADPGTGTGSGDPMRSGGNLFKRFDTILGPDQGHADVYGAPSYTTLGYTPNVYLVAVEIT